MRRLTWKEQRELEGLEARIEGLEAQRTALQAEVNASGDDYLRLQDLAEQLHTGRSNWTRRWGAGWIWRSAATCNPVFDVQPCYSGELGRVVCYQGQPQTERVGGDK